jgi:uncharacterized protein with PQ loop repeat
MNGSLTDLAGFLASLVFMASYLPMLAKAVRTRDLSSYSRSNLVLVNVGNAVYSVYVFSLPFGPIWLLHAFYVVSSALMLLWSLRYRGRGEKAVEATPATAGRHLPRPRGIWSPTQSSSRA